MLVTDVLPWSAAANALAPSTPIRLALTARKPVKNNRSNGVGEMARFDAQFKLTLSTALLVILAGEGPAERNKRARVRCKIQQKTQKIGDRPSKSLK